MTTRETIKSIPKKDGEGSNEYCRRVSKESGIKYNSVQRMFYKMQKEKKLEYAKGGERETIIKEINENEKEVVGNALTLDDLLDALEVDLNIWEVKEWRIESSNWDVASKWRDQDLEWEKNHLGEQVMQGHAKRKNEWLTKNNKAFRIKVRLVRKISKGLEEVLKATAEEMKKYIPPVLKIKHSKHEKCISVINIFDAHIDKLALVTETGVGSSLDENIELFETFFDKLLAKELLNNPELIYFPVGSDFFNTNGLGAPTTKKGTPQDVMVKPVISFPLGVSVLRRCIDKSSQHCPVVVPVIRGNHDDDKTFYLGHSLSLVYENNANVEVDDSRLNRKYYRYGVSVIGFAHGNFEKRKIDEFPTRALIENRKHMVDADRIEMFLGDIHHKQETKFTRTKDFPGVTMRFLRSVGTTDLYHHDNGYVGIPKTAEGFSFNYDKGLEGNSMVTIK